MLVALFVISPSFLRCFFFFFACPSLPRCFLFCVAEIYFFYFLLGASTKACIKACKLAKILFWMFVFCYLFSIFPYLLRLFVNFLFFSFFFHLNGKHFSLQWWILIFVFFLSFQPLAPTSSLHKIVSAFLRSIILAFF